MGNIVADLITRQDCKLFLNDFPNNIGELNIASTAFSLTGIPCSRNPNVAGNLIGNFGLLLGLYAINKTGFGGLMGKIFPNIISKDDTLNAVAIEYLFINVLLLVQKLYAGTKSFTDTGDILDLVEETIFTPSQIPGEVIKFAKSFQRRNIVSRAPCDRGFDNHLGGCYEYCSDIGFQPWGLMCIHKRKDIAWTNYVDELESKREGAITFLESNKLSQNLLLNNAVLESGNLAIEMDDRLTAYGFDSVSIPEAETVTTKLAVSTGIVASISFLEEEIGKAIFLMASLPPKHPTRAVMIINIREAEEKIRKLRASLFM